MRALDPDCWNDGTADEVSTLLFPAEKFSQTLSVRGFNVNKIKQEWKEMKCDGKHYFPSTLSIHELWQRLPQTRGAQSSNLSLLVEVIMVVGVGNSSVESCSYYLMATLSDRCLPLAQHYGRPPHPCQPLCLARPRAARNCGWSPEDLHGQVPEDLPREEIPTGLGEAPSKKCIVQAVAAVNGCDSDLGDSEVSASSSSSSEFNNDSEPGDEEDGCSSSNGTVVEVIDTDSE